MNSFISKVIHRVSNKSSKSTYIYLKDEENMELNINGVYFPVDVQLSPLAHIKKSYKKKILEKY